MPRAGSCSLLSFGFPHSQTGFTRPLSLFPSRYPKAGRGRRGRGGVARARAGAGSQTRGRGCPCTCVGGAWRHQIFRSHPCTCVGGASGFHVEECRGLWIVGEGVDPGESDAIPFAITVTHLFFREVFRFRYGIFHLSRYVLRKKLLQPQKKFNRLKLPTDNHPLTSLPSPRSHFLWLTRTNPLKF